MGNPSAGNILKSGAAIWYAPVGEARPDETTVNAGAAWGGNWARVGFTKAPLAFKFSQEITRFMTEEMLGPVAVRKIGQGLELETVLAEITADYMNLVTGGQSTVAATAAGASQKGYSQFNMSNSARITSYAIGFEGVQWDSADVQLPLRIFLDNAFFILNGDLEFSKKNDDYTGVPLRVVSLTPTESDFLFTWQQVTAPATS